MCSTEGSVRANFQARDSTGGWYIYYTICVQHGVTCVQTVVSLGCLVAAISLDALDVEGQWYGVVVV